MRKGQAFDTMKLLIAAVVAVSILSILGTILGRMSTYAYCNPFDDVATELRTVSQNPGVTRSVGPCMLKGGDVIPTTSYKTKALLTTQALVLVCGPGMEGMCTNGMSPNPPSATQLNEMSNDNELSADSAESYWPNGPDEYKNQRGQLGAAAGDTPMSFRVTCGSTYCKIIALAG